MSCMTMLFLNLEITTSDITPHKKLAVSLVIAHGHLIFLRGLCGYVWVNILTLSSPRGDFLVVTIHSKSCSVFKIHEAPGELLQ